MFHKSWESRVNALAPRLARSVRAQYGIQRVGTAAAPAGNVKARVRAAHELTQLAYSRTRELWYGRARRVDDAELAAIEAAIPPDTVEFTVAYVRSIENRVAALLDELVAVRARCEAELATRGDGPVRPPGAGGDRVG